MCCWVAGEAGKGRRRRDGEGGTVKAASLGSNQDLLKANERTDFKFEKTKNEKLKSVLDLKYILKT